MYQLIVGPSLFVAGVTAAGALRAHARRRREAGLRPPPRARRRVHTLVAATAAAASAAGLAATLWPFLAS